MVLRDSQLTLSEESEQKIQQIARKTPTQKEIDCCIGLRKRKKWGKERDIENQKEARKRKREDDLIDKLKNVQMITDPALIPNLTKTVIWKQLKLQKRTNPTKQIQLTGNRVTLMNHLIEILK